MEKNAITCTLWIFLKFKKTGINVGIWANTMPNIEEIHWTDSDIWLIHYGWQCLSIEFKVINGFKNSDMYQKIFFSSLIFSRIKNLHFKVIKNIKLILHLYFFFKSVKKKKNNKKKKNINNFYSKYIDKYMYVYIYIYIYIYIFVIICV